MVLSLCPSLVPASMSVLDILGVYSRISDWLQTLSFQTELFLPQQVGSGTHTHTHMPTYYVAPQEWVDACSYNSVQ